MFIFSFSEQVLGRVTDLRVTNANGRRIRIAWTGVAEATGYRVTWRQGNSKCYMNLTTLNLDLLLPIITPYLIWVCNCSNGSSVLVLAGPEQSRILGAEANTFTIEGLQPDEALIIGVAGIFDQRVGEAVTVSSRTKSYGGSVSGLRVTAVTSQRIRIVWSPFSRATSYKVTWQLDNGKKS